MIERRNGRAYCEDTLLDAIVRRYGTPCYVYSLRVLRERAKRFIAACAPWKARAFYAIKANANPKVLREVHRFGFGVDAVSGGEFAAALAAKVPPEHRIFSGVGKTDEELALAVRRGVRALLIESPEEWGALASIAAKAKKPIRVGLRLNPDLLAPTHRKIATGDRGAKFGLTDEEARALVNDISAQRYLRLEGLSCHIGSQLTELDPFRIAVQWMVDQARFFGEAGKTRLRWIDMGGGLAIRYRDETPPEVEEYIATIARPIREAGYEPWFEPGRWVVGPAGALLTRVLALRPRGNRHFAVVDAGMTELMRPALYEAWHPIEAQSEGPTSRTVDVVGPLCETGDILGESRPMPALSRGELLWVAHAGAYGRAMASQYNQRGFAPEVFVDGHRFQRVDTGIVRAKRAGAQRR